MPFLIEISIIELNLGEVTASVHHGPKVCAVGDPLLPGTKKERMGEPTQPTHEKLVANVSQE